MPRTLNATLEANEGLSRTLDARLYMGSNTTPIDAEANGLPGLEADGDDTTGIDDDDGIADFAPLSSDQTTYEVRVAVHNALENPATLVGWINCDGNGTFDPDEAVTASVDLGQIEATLSFALPSDIEPGDTYARFWLTTNGITGNDPGGSATNGEVEDCALTIAAMSCILCEIGGTETGPILFKGVLTNARPVAITGIDPTGTGRGYSRNPWIRLKVTDVGIDGDPICPPTSDGHTGGSRYGHKKGGA